MKHGPASTRVDAVTTPFSSKRRVMPSFRPSNAWIICLELDFDVDASRDVEAHQGVDSFGGGLQDVDQPLMSTHLELFPGVLVDEWAANHSESLDASRQRHGASHNCSRALRRLDDLLR